MAKRLPVKVLVELEAEIDTLPPSRARDIARALAREIRRARRIPTRADTLERAMSKVSPEPNTGCWLWTGACNANGYGYFESRLVDESLAHRTLYALLVGPIRSGLDLLHKCDNPACVNPDHMAPGTQRENVADMVAKGRQCNGERNPMAKTTAEQARQLVRDYIAGECLTVLGPRYGMSRANVYRVLAGERWGSATAQVRAGLVMREPRKGKGKALTEQAVKAIRARYDAGESTWALAREFGASPAHVYAVARRLKWKHVA